MRYFDCDTLPTRGRYILATANKSASDEAPSQSCSVFYLSQCAIVEIGYDGTYCACACMLDACVCAVNGLPIRHAKTYPLQSTLH